MIPVIIPHFQKAEQLKHCVHCLKQQSLAVDIFIRDNNENNVFFTAAVNEGIQTFLNRECDYMVILNQDMYLKPDAVQAMVELMKSQPQCGITMPLQIHATLPDTCICAGGLEAFPFGKHSYGPLAQFTSDEPVAWANGACMMLRKEMIQDIGLLDKNYIFIGSDSDYCFTARSRGWEVWRCAAAHGIHEHGASGRSDSPTVELLKINDMLYFARKWLTGQLYRELALEGPNCTPQHVNQIVHRLQQCRYQAMAAPQPAVPCPSAATL